MAPALCRLDHTVPVATCSGAVLSAQTLPANTTTFTDPIGAANPGGTRYELSACNNWDAALRRL